MNTTLIHKRKVRDYALHCAKPRAHKFTRVSARFYYECDSVVKNFIAQHVASLPSKGKTIS